LPANSGKYWVRVCGRDDGNGSGGRVGLNIVHLRVDPRAEERASKIQRERKRGCGSSRERAHEMSGQEDMEMRPGTLRDSGVNFLFEKKGSWKQKSSEVGGSENEPIATTITLSP